MVETKVIKMTPKKMLGILFQLNGKWWFIGIFLVIAVLVILGIALDYKFLILSLLWIFMVGPLLMVFLYFYQGMRPLTTFNTIPHKILFSQDNLKIEFIKEETLQDTDLSHKRVEENSKDLKAYTADLKLFQEIKSGGDYILLIFNKIGWIWLPLSAFDNPIDMRNIIDQFSHNV